jgi:hypothetical protein
MLSIAFAALDLIVILEIVFLFSRISALSLSFLNFSKSSLFILHYSSNKGSNLHDYNSQKQYLLFKNLLLEFFFVTSIGDTRK